RRPGSAPRPSPAAVLDPEPASPGRNLDLCGSFASSLLGARALEDGVGAGDWVALGLLVGIGTLAVLLLWPYYNLTFRFDPEDLLARYVDVAEPSSMAPLHRELALRLTPHWHPH